MAKQTLWARHEAVNDDMNTGTINVLWFPQVYWIFVGIVIGAFTVVNVLNNLIYRQRLSAASRSLDDPARPKNVLTKSFATLTAVTRELSNASLTSSQFAGISWSQPTFGKFSLVAANFIFVMILDFYALSPNQYYDYENVAYRAAFLSLGMIPLIFLLAGKNSIIGWLTGTSYERLNFLHRWVARTILLTTTLHMAYWFRSWAPYNQIRGQLTSDSTTQLGISAWVVLLWIVFSSLSPIRGWRYEVFVIQHVISMAAFITLVFLHTPTSDHVWLWPAVAFYFFDRLTRAAYTFFTNCSLFHPRQRRTGDMSPLWACRGTLTPLSFNATRITINNPPLTWRAGQHAFISLHGLIPLQSHPFTISSLPSDNKLEFLVKARAGGTKRIFSHAENCLSLPTADVETTVSAPKTVAVSIEGPYGRIRPLRQFDSVVLVAGSTGVTFTLPLLRDIVEGWKAPSNSDTRRRFWHTPAGAATRHVRFVWVVKNLEQTAWFSEQLRQVAEDVQLLRKAGRDVGVELAVYITCDETLTSESREEGEKLPEKRGPPMMLQPSASGSETSVDEKEKAGVKDTGTADVDIKAIDSRLESRSDVSSLATQPKTGGSGTNPALKTCQPDGTCCCRTAITSAADEAEGTAIECNCAGCSHPVPTTPPETTATSPPPLHSSIATHTGRPTPRPLILPVLESARGETAVVACGPRGLNEEVRRCVVGLSDERAACKGSGAMGVWYWGEGFGW